MSPMMTHSRNSMLVLLGFVASIQAVPAPRPQSDAQVARQITLYPPTYSISWNGPQPTSSADPGEPEEPSPLPSDSITLGSPSASISWNGHQVPTTTKLPGWPTKKSSTKNTTTTKSPISYTVSWGKRQFSYEIEPTEFLSDPEDDGGDGGPILIPTFVIPKPTDTIRITPPTATIIWGKRQLDDDPDWPDDPGNSGDGVPVVYHPGGSPENPGDTIIINPPTATITWGRRQEDEDPTETLILDLSTPTDVISNAPPTAFISWGKRQEDDDGPTTFIPDLPIPTNVISNAPPTASVSWGKRQADEITIVKPTGTIIWGKRPDEDGDDLEPTEINNTLVPVPTDNVTLDPPSATVTWGKRPYATGPTAAADNTKAEAAIFKCGSTNRVTRIRPCPTYSCGNQCTLAPGSSTVVPPVINTETSILECPLTATASNVCASCKRPTTLVSQWGPTITATPPSVVFG